jgi:HPt (histidine-containing phosphotransfer) domain-containing protein
MSNATTACPLELKEALDRAGDDREFLKELIEIFLEDAPLRITGLRDGLTGGDPTAVATNAHSLKGAAANLAAHDVRERAWRIERRARDGELSGLDTEVEQLAAEIDAVRSFAAGFEP